MALSAAVSIAVFLSVKPAHAKTFTVNITADVPDGNLADRRCVVSIFGGCTLRAAIQEANDTPGADEIRFAIPDDPNVPGAEVKTIEVGATGNGELPDITDTVTIDGYTQGGA